MTEISLDFAINVMNNCEPDFKSGVQSESWEVIRESLDELRKAKTIIHSHVTNAITALQAGDMGSCLAALECAKKVLTEEKAK